MRSRKCQDIFSTRLLTLPFTHTPLLPSPTTAGVFFLSSFLLCLSWLDSSLGTYCSKCSPWSSHSTELIRLASIRPCPRLVALEYAKYVDSKDPPTWRWVWGSPSLMPPSGGEPGVVSHQGQYKLLFSTYGFSLPLIHPPPWLSVCHSDGPWNHLVAVRSFSR